MKKWKIVTDSGGDFRHLDNLAEDVAFSVVPLILNIGNQTIQDSPDLELEAFVDFMKQSKDNSSTACPSPDTYAQHYQGAENVICFTITSELSGSYNSASLGRDLVLEENPDTNIYIFDSKSAGGEMDLLIKKAADLANMGVSFDEMVQELTQYHKHTQLAFILHSVDNLQRNGRISKIVAQMVGLLNIRLIGTRTKQGTIDLAHKARGDKRSLKALMNEMKDKGYQGGKVIISHVLNESGAQAAKEMILQEYPEAVVELLLTSGLCSYYAEDQGYIVGYEIN